LKTITYNKPSKQNQKQNSKRAMENGEPVSIRRGYEDLCGSDILALRKSQVNRMRKVYNNKVGHSCLDVELTGRVFFCSDN